MHLPSILSVAVSLLAASPALAYTGGSTTGANLAIREAKRQRGGGGGSKAPLAGVAVFDDQGNRLTGNAILNTGKRDLEEREPKRKNRVAQDDNSDVAPLAGVEVFDDQGNRLTGNAILNTGKRDVEQVERREAKKGRGGSAAPLAGAVVFDQQGNRLQGNAILNSALKRDTEEVERREAKKGRGGRGGGGSAAPLAGAVVFDQQGNRLQGNAILNSAL